MGRSETSRLPDDVVTHGICESCHDNLTFQHGVPLGEYLDSLPHPVVAVDGDGVVLLANARACEALGKNPKDMIGQRGGNVFECAYARLPEGCGRTIHCSGCAIRRAVTKTFETGEPRYRVPATLMKDDPDHPSAVSMTITTVKAGDTVFLRVERMGPPT